MSSLRQSLDQKRAEQALKDVNQVNDSNSDKFKSKYAGLARKTPASVQSSGLGQSLAFLRAKAGQNRTDEHWTMYVHISAWVIGQIRPAEKPDHFLEWVIEQDTSMYRRATAEAMAYLNWLKRFAEALLPPPKDED